MPQIPSSVLKAMGKPGKQGMMDLIDAMQGAGMLAKKKATSVVERYTPESSFMRGTSRIIPSETSTGQTSMFSYGRFSTPRPKALTQEAAEAKAKAKLMPMIKASSTPPFKGGGRFTSTDPRAAVMGAARREELAQKRKRKGK